MEDYYILEHDSGCCLNCSDAEPGCLCYDCCCTSCCWYIPPERWDGENGHCGKTKSKEEMKKWYIEQAEAEFKKAKLLIEANEKIKKAIDNNWYSCQKCRRDFISEEDLQIIPYKKPFCPLCIGKIKIKEDGSIKRGSEEDI
jgi:hypothetical protein